MQRALVAAANACGIGLFVDAKNEQARIYYLRYGFESLESSPLQMFLPFLVIESFLKQKTEPN